MKVYTYNWGEKVPVVSTPNTKTKGVIVHEDVARGYVIILKPAGIPVHACVYNGKENVLCMLKEAMLKRHPNECLEMSCPQRLDTGTSGVLAVATRSAFSSYLGKLLERKTLQQQRFVTPVTKIYQCLICLRETDDIAHLEKFVAGGEVVTHFLLSDRTLPRVFRDSPDEELGSDWQICRLRIVAIEQVAEKLRGAALRSDASCSSVCRIEVELLTGRPHQIRGQMAALGFPLIGDVLYGGAEISADDDNAGSTRDRIALHCCELSFPEPNIIDGQKKKPKEQLVPSSKVVTYRCNDAWWDNE
jgi:23S rRNA-/tRNA-specific pseudouridylate synthase